MSDPLVLSEDVRDAVGDGRAVVALETSVLAQGLPHPRNVEAMEAMTAAIRGAGAEPAWVWVRPGAVQVGATEADLARLSEDPRVVKAARRDLPMVVGGDRLGATTVSATVWAAARAGIEVTVTGGIGGVHPGSGDVSADLVELARTPGTLVSSGPKSIVDPLATLERIEELGIAVLGYRCDRLPFFLARETDIVLEHHAAGSKEVATFSRARRDLGIESALLVLNPIPADRAMDPAIVSEAVRQCERQAAREGVSGKSVTPFLLACLSQKTGGASLDANLALLESNAAVAAEIAVALSP